MIGKNQSSCFVFNLFKRVVVFWVFLDKMNKMARKKRKNRGLLKPNFNNNLLKPKLDLKPVVKRIIISLIILCFGLIVIFSFFELSGPWGEAINSFLENLFGIGKLFFPIILFLVSYLVLKNEPSEKKDISYLKIFLGAFLIFNSLLALMDLGFDYPMGSVANFLISLNKFIGLWPTFLVYLTTLAIGLVISFWDTFEAKKEKQKTTLSQKALNKIEKPQPESLKQKLETFEKQPILEAKPIKQEKEKPEIFKRISYSSWEFPPFDLLEADGSKPTAENIKVNSQIIQRTLADFGILVEMGDVLVGPTVTQYTLKPAQGVKLSRISALQNDLALALAAHPLRIEAPIPGKSLVGIEVPNRIASIVRLRQLIENGEFQKSPSPLTFPLGRDVAGNPVFSDISKLPHLLIAGATGSGKSIFIHSLIISLLYRNPPQLLKLILIDPKRVELTSYSEIPYLLTPVITDGKKAISALRWAVNEMERRYEILLEAQSRDINSYNQKFNKEKEKLLPPIIIIIDELADLMSIYGKELEGVIIRLSQMARATGIHLIVSTQRPSVEVITGLIKANITSRVAFQVASQVDSRTILDSAGAEKLLGKGDMLFISSELSKPRRIQSPLVSEKEVEKVVSYIKKTAKKFATEIETESLDFDEEILSEEIDLLDVEEDELYNQAYKLVVETQKASASFLQRRLRIGYARAARLLDLLESRGVIGPIQGAKPREVYISKENKLESNSNLNND
ncbi:MAG TPA: DNA translocase FtsK [Candidatus Paceibacterota bacterium]|nr:DNA translocase FtsK [Candidatus Paceibacterota bacterium]